MYHRSPLDKARERKIEECRKYQNDLLREQSNHRNEISFILSEIERYRRIILNMEARLKGYGYDSEVTKLERLMERITRFAPERSNKQAEEVALATSKRSNERCYHVRLIDENGFYLIDSEVGDKPILDIEEAELLNTLKLRLMYVRRWKDNF